MSNPQFLHSLLQHDRGLFVNVARAVREDGLEYRPEPRSRSARDLLEHLIGHNLDMIELLDDGVIHHRMQVPFGTVDEAAELLDSSFADIMGRLESMDDHAFMAPSKFMVGDDVIMEGPKMQLAWVLYLDSVHHRGQLSTYLRPMGSKVPAIYGPSADDEGPGH